MFTKACSLTEDEITRLIEMYGDDLGNKYDDEKIERINYLNKRLKSFKEVEITKEEPAPVKAQTW